MFASPPTTATPGTSSLPSAECTADQLEAVAAFVGQLGALKVTNTSATPCTLRGRPVVTRVAASGATIATADSVFHRAGEAPEPVAPIVLAARGRTPGAAVLVEVCAETTAGERFGIRFGDWPVAMLAATATWSTEACGANRSLFASDVVRPFGAGGINTSDAGSPSDGGWWMPTAWTAEGEEQGATDPLADGRYIGIVTIVGSDTISFDLVTTAPSEADRAAAVALGLLRPGDAEIDGALINRSSRARRMTVAADAKLRRLEPFGTANLVDAARSELTELVRLAARSGSVFNVDVRAGRVIAMDERYHP